MAQALNLHFAETFFMRFSLNKRTKAIELKKQFRNRFPFLKIEIFCDRQCATQGSAPEQMLKDEVILSEALPQYREGEFIFTPAVTVASFEQQLQVNHGLTVKVFRRTGSTWLKTSCTGHLTLKRQHEMGEETLQPVHFNTNTLFL